MKPVDSSSFRKHFYWLDPLEQDDAIAELKKDKKRVYKAKHQACEGLYPRREMVLVKPKVWDGRCGRQGSWYRASKRKGQYLLVSNNPLNEFDLGGTISLEEFHPPLLASDEEVVAMTSDPKSLEIIPDGWGEFSPWEVSAIRKYLEDEGRQLSLEQIFLYYTANHINFHHPRLYVQDNGCHIIPYSIQETTLVCSACIELFGILGEAFPRKYLAPCPGLKYVKAPKGIYLRVDQESGKE